ncbi:hypothetical protein [Numidum massiliense]|uniref:hypothetical protein n=1 Tax=Numidum massiliense TaxID=1522315 RepID=UPI0006D587AF|nr:hypothetical protein [Numidum massiliense]
MKVSYDPKFFEWHQGTNEKAVQGEKAITIHPKNGQIRISAAAGRTFEEKAELIENRYFRVEIGIAPKAIAVRPVTSNSNGYRAFMAKGSKALKISCKYLISTLEWNLSSPIKIIAFWDEKHRMLVGKIS